MLYTLINALWKRDKLGGTGFYPIPTWLRYVMASMSNARKLALYARLSKGTRLTFTAPDGLGCAECVSRILNVLWPGILPITVSTTQLNESLRNSTKIYRTDTPSDGTIIMAATGEGVGHGHVGVVVGSVVYSNNSDTNTWDSHLSVRMFVAHFQGRGFPIRYYNVK